MSDSAWRRTDIKYFPRGNNPLGNDFYGYARSDIELPDGTRAVYNGADVGPTVHIVPIEEDESLHLVLQDRPNASTGPNIPKTLELPGGFAHPELPLEDSALTELREEIGVHAQRLTVLGKLYVAPGMSNELDTIFLGQDLIPVSSTNMVPTEATEQSLKIVTMPFARAYDLFTSGKEPVSAATLAGLALAKKFLK